MKKLLGKKDITYKKWKDALDPILQFKIKKDYSELKSTKPEGTMKPDDSKNIFHYENISVDSAIVNWNKIKGEGRRVKHFYIELSDIKEKQL